MGIIIPSFPPNARLRGGQFFSAATGHSRLVLVLHTSVWQKSPASSRGKPQPSPQILPSKKKKKSHPALSVAAPPSPDYSPERDHMETFSDMHTCTLRGRKRFLFAAVKTVIKNKPCQTGTRPPRGQLRFLMILGKAKQIHSHSAADTYRSNAYVQFSH